MADYSKKFQISEEERAQTPPRVRELLKYLLAENAALKKKIADEFIKQVFPKDIIQDMLPGSAH